MKIKTDEVIQALECIKGNAEADLKWDKEQYDKALATVIKHGKDMKYNEMLIDEATRLLEAE